MADGSEEALELLLFGQNNHKIQFELLAGNVTPGDMGHSV